MIARRCNLCTRIHLCADPISECCCPDCLGGDVTTVWQPLKVVRRREVAR